MLKTHICVIIAIAALGAALWFLPAGQWDLWGPDEGRYTLVARELLRGENPFFLTVNGEPYPDKPFLPFWVIAAALAPSGGEVNEQLARAPAVAMALLVILMTYFIGARRWGPRAGALAAAILFTSYLFTDEATAVRLDMQLTFWATLGIFALALGRRLHTGRMALVAAAVFWLAMGAAMLTKGPVALLFPLGWLVGEAWGRRSWRPLWHIALIPGALFLAAVMGWWYWMQTQMHPPEFVAEQTVGQILPRLFDPEGHIKPPWYFLMEMLFSGFLPWSPFLVAAAVYLWRSRREGLFRLQPALAATIGWIVIPFLILSIIPGKREQYILPLYPALALLTGWYASEVIWTRLAARWARWPLAAMLALAGVAIAALGASYGMEHDLLSKAGLMLEKNEAYALIGVGLAFVIPAIGLALARRWGGVTVWVAAAGVLAVGLQTWFVLPAMNMRKSARPLNLYLARVAAPVDGWVGAFEGDDKAEYQVYTRVRFQEVDYKGIAKGGGAGIEALPPVLFGETSHWKVYGEAFTRAGYRLESDFFEWPDDYSIYVHEDRYTSAVMTRAVAALAAGRPLRFFFFGDSGEPSERLHRLVGQAARRHAEHPAAAAFLLGDNAYKWAPPARLMDICFIDPFLPLLREGVPFHAIFGNHDNDVEGLTTYQSRYPLLGMGGRNFYTVSYGDGLADFFCLDTTTLDDDGDPGQRAWFREAIHASTARWKIALTHKPPYASQRSHGASGAMQRLLEDAGWREAGIDAVLSGDNHWYERRGDVPGVLLLVNGGSSGPERKGLPKGDDFRLQYESRRASAVQFDITPESLRFQAFTERGKVVDEGEVLK